MTGQSLLTLFSLDQCSSSQMDKILAMGNPRDPEDGSRPSATSQITGSPTVNQNLCMNNSQSRTGFEPSFLNNTLYCELVAERKFNNGLCSHLKKLQLLFI